MEDHVIAGRILTVFENEENKKVFVICPDEKSAKAMHTYLTSTFKKPNYKLDLLERSDEFEFTDKESGNLIRILTLETMRAVEITNLHSVLYNDKVQDLLETAGIIWHLMSISEDWKDKE